MNTKNQLVGCLAGGLIWSAVALQASAAVPDAMYVQYKQDEDAGSGTEEKTMRLSGFDAAGNQVFSAAGSTFVRQSDQVVDMLVTNADTSLIALAKDGRLRTMQWDVEGSGSDNLTAKQVVGTAPYAYAAHYAEGAGGQFKVTGQLRVNGLITSKGLSTDAVMAKEILVRGEHNTPKPVQIAAPREGSVQFEDVELRSSLNAVSNAQVTVKNSAVYSNRFSVIHSNNLTAAGFSTIYNTQPGFGSVVNAKDWEGREMESPGFLLIVYENTDKEDDTQVMVTIGSQNRVLLHSQNAKGSDDSRYKTPATFFVGRGQSWSIDADKNVNLSTYWVSLY